MFSNRVAIAWLNLTANKIKLFLSVFGIAFAVVLMFVELGFHQAFYDSATVLTHQLKADLIMVARDRKGILGNLTFPRIRLYQALMLETVQAVYPLYIHTASWRNPENYRLYQIRVIGLDPLQSPLAIETISQHQFDLQLPDTLLADEKSKAWFGRFYPGLETELDKTRIRVLETFSLGSDFLNHGTVMMSDKNFAKLLWPSQSLERVAIGLIVTKPSADLTVLKNQLAAHLPDDIRLYTKSEFITIEKQYWKKLSPVGTLFLIGVFAGFVTGLFVCYQVLNNEVLTYLREFATLKAMGYNNRDIIKIVLQQSLFLSLFGFMVGLIISKQVCVVIASTVLMPITWDASLAFITFLLTVVMCVIAGLGASLKVMDANPADLF